MRVCLDTSVLIGFLRGEPRAVPLYLKVRSGEEALVSAVSVYELLCGVRSEREGKAIRNVLHDAEILPFSENTAERSARIYRDLRAEGRTVGTADILIAGSALAAGTVLATLNRRDFSWIRGLQIFD